MPKLKSVFVCQNCGAKAQKWTGQCFSCRAWNTLVEEVVVAPAKKGLGQSRQVSSGAPVKLSSIKPTSKDSRTPSGSSEFDRVLGGGIVKGSVVLIGGEPGIGKSTLLTQLALKLCQTGPVLYVCGEESPEQVKLRVDRLLETNQTISKDNNLDHLLMLPETDVDSVVLSIQEEKPALCIVDSIQTMMTGDLSGMSGSVGQVRESTHRLISAAKQNGIPIFIVGHVTKEGSIAGPKVLEHMVDAVLNLTGERTGMWRILRAEKNRFGATDEVGVFSMAEGGLVDVLNPSGAFLEESQAGVPGSAVVAVMEGTRPVLVEVQALTVESQLPVPRRIAHGININKLQLLSAVLQKRTRLSLGTRDIFVNVAGGLKLNEPASDLGIALAIASSFKNKALPPETVVIGEVGLLGEIRRVAHLKRRTDEAKKLGYATIVSPDKYKSLGQAVKSLLG